MAEYMKLIENSFFMIVFMIFAGLAAGKISGDLILSSALNGNITILTFIFSPSQSFIDTHSLLNESNDYRRLSGYYAYRESGKIDMEFLAERYKSENSEIIKKVIIWIAEGCSDKEKLVDFYRKIYNLSPENIKKILDIKIEK